MASKKSGLKVGHDIKDFNEGIDYVLTLKDKNILAEDDDNNDLDELENNLIKEYNKKKAKDSNHVILDFNIQSAMNESDEKKEILAHYDKEKEKSFILDDGTNNSESTEKQGEINKIKEKLRQLKEAKNPSKLVELGIEKKIISDTMTHEEFMAKQPKKFKKVNIVKKGFKSLVTFEEDELNKQVGIDKNIEDKPNNIKKPEYNEHEELDKFLEKQRNITNKSRIANIQPEERIREFIDKSKEKDNEMNVDLEKDNKVQINETTEFLKNIPTRQEIEKNYKLVTSSTPISFKDIKSGTASIVHMPLPTDRLKYGLNSIIDINKDSFLGNKREREPERIQTDVKVDKEATDTGTEFNEPDSVMEELEEPPLGKGIGEALKIFRKRGMLAKEKLYGRSNDSIFTTNEKIDERERHKDVNLEYRDAKGRLMTPKEAYRYLCYIFHNKRPGKKKLEKKLVKEQMEEKQRNVDAGFNTKTFKYLKAQQVKTNSPFVILQGKNNNL